MKIFYSAIMAAMMLFSVSVQAQQVSDEVLPEAKTALATKFEFLSPEVAASLAAKARGEPILAKDWMVAVANPHAAAAGARVLKEGGTAAIRSFSGANSACRTPIAVACSISDSSAALDRVVRFGYNGNL